MTPGAIAADTMIMITRLPVGTDVTMVVSQSASDRWSIVSRFTGTGYIVRSVSAL